MGDGSAAREEEVALAADAEPYSWDAIMSTTRAGIVSSWNPPAVLLYCYLAEDIVGRTADVLLRVLTSQGMLDPNVALVKKPFTEVELMGMAAQVLNGHFGGCTADYVP